MKKAKNYSQKRELNRTKGRRFHCNSEMIAYETVNIYDFIKW